MADTTEKLITKRRMLMMLTLFTAFCSMYMLFYNANWAEFGDPPYLYNITASLVRYQDTQFDLMAYNFPQRPDNVFFSDRLYPLFDYGEDILSVMLATPLYWLAYNVDGIGLTQTVWLFNVFVVALSGVVMFLYALALGYNERTAVLSALVLGLTSALVPYAKSFMQEPITLLVTLTLALVLERWRVSGYRNWKLFIAIPILVFALFNSKFSAPVAIPGLIAIAFPYIRLAPRYHQWWRIAETVFFIGVAFFIVAVSFIDLRPLFSPLTSYIPDFDSPYIMIAMRTYFFSVSASMWGTTPLALLAIPGGWLLYKRGHTRYLWAGVLIILGYTFGYAVLRGESWFGSVTWAPRFLIPTLPYWLLLGLLMINRVANAPRTRLLTGVFIALFAYGMWIQFNGISYHWEAYDKLLPQGMILGDGDGAYDPTLMPWVLLPQKWDDTPFDIVWVRMNLLGFPLIFGALALACLGWLFYQLRQQNQRRMWLKTSILLLSFLLMVAIALPSIYNDPLYHAYNRELRQMVSIIEEEAHPPDMVFMTGAEHVEFMFNYGDVRNARLVGLPFQPGEQYSPEQPPLVESDTLTDEMFNPTTIPLLNASAERREHLWLLTEFSAFHWWARRPIEQYMATAFYPLREIATAPSVRLIEFATGTPLNGESPAEIETDYHFGEHVRLPRINLPLGTTYSAGDTLPVAFNWLTDALLDTDYTVAVFLSDVAHQRIPVQGWDTQPVLGFAPTTSWQVGEPVVDNRALRLPEDLPAGEYEIWVRLYHAEDDGSLDILSIDGENVFDIGGDIAVLPVTIVVSE